MILLTPNPEHRTWKDREQAWLRERDALSRRLRAVEQLAEQRIKETLNPMICFWGTPPKGRTHPTKIVVKFAPAAGGTVEREGLRRALTQLLGAHDDNIFFVSQVCSLAGPLPIGL